MVTPPSRPPIIYQGNAFTSLENDGSELRKIFSRFSIFPIVMISVSSPLILVAFTDNISIFAPTISPLFIFLFYLILSLISLSGFFTLLLAIFLGSFIFGILLRLEFQNRATKVWGKSVVYLSFFISSLFLFHVTPLYIAITPPIFLLQIVLSVIQFVGFLIFFVGLIMLPGLMGVVLPFENLFGDRRERTNANAVMYRNFLLLTTVPPGEPVKYCPFKDVRKNTCSYLNYPTPEGPLICDYQSTFTRCLAYGRLVQKLELVVE